MSNLTVFIPSNRRLSAARHALETAIIFAEKSDCALIISDNSGDDQKRTCFEGCSPNLTYLVSPGTTAYENARIALDRATTPFVMPMGDDDALYRLDGMAPCDLGALPADVVAVRPRTMSWTMDDGVYSVDQLALLDADAGQRLALFNREAKNNNSIYYSIYRAEPFRNLLALFDHHPTGGSYCDWAMSFALIACGRVLHDPSLVFGYDLGRWRGKSGVERSLTDLYRQAGLPDHAVKYDALLRFLDAFVFMSMSRLPIATEQRPGVQRISSRLALNAFVRAFRETPGAYGPATAEFVRHLRTLSDTNAAFEAALPVLEEIRPGLGAEYERFYALALAS